MNNQDYMVRGIAGDGRVRAFAATSRILVEEARRIHDTTPVVTAALGRLLTAGAMMGTMMKGDKDEIILRIQGDGPLRGLHVRADSLGNVRGYPYESHVDIPPKRRGKLDVGGAVGAGFLSVIRDIGLKEPYVGEVKLVSGEIAEDITYYFAESEQTPSSVGLGVLVNRDYTVRQAGGFIIQLMPDASEEIIGALEEKLAAIPPVTAMLEDGKTPEEILTDLLGELDYRETERIPLRYTCPCSRERVVRALISIGKKELLKLAEEEEKTEVRCPFCSRRYLFSAEELRKLAE